MHLEVLNETNRELFQQLKNFEDFYLAGGTGLALQIGHRISVDFDLFSPEPISKKLLPKVRRVFAPKTIRLSVSNVDELTVFVGGVKLSFIYYPFTVINSLIDYKGIRLLNTAEIAATKAYTIGRRGSFKDYIDLYFVISGKYASLEEIIGLAEKKYQAEFNSRLFLEQLLYLEDIDEAKMFFLKETVTKNNLIKFFEQEIGKIKL